MTADENNKETAIEPLKKMSSEGEAATSSGGGDENKTLDVPAPPALGSEEEEDIPPDFFDDFSNQDFMEGLDIVDTWDDDMQEEGEIAEPKTKEDETLNEDNCLTEDKKQSFNSGKHARIIFPKELEQRPFRNKNSYERSARFKDLREKIGRSEERRDPEKTRRDILRDKEKCAKDKEVKIINERLRVVETGLVPPGMEMEVDLSEIRSKQESLKPTIDARSKPGDFKNTSPGGYAPKSDSKINKSKFRSRSRSRSFERFRFRVRLKSRSRSRSREKRRTRDRPSPPPRRRLRSRSRSRSPYYDRFFSSREKRLSGERKFSRERKFKPKRGTKEKDRSGSPSSDLSDREKWLVRRYRRSVSPRKRSFSPERKRPKDTVRRLDVESKEEKHSFLEEIHKKLNETTHSSQVAVQHTMQLRTTYVPMQAPQPVPPVSQNPFGSQIVPSAPFDQSQYDQQFFIGTCDISPNPQPVPFVQPTPVPPPAPLTILPPPAPLTVLPQSQTIPPPTSFHSPNSDYSIVSLISENPHFPPQRKETEKKALEETDKKALSKLLDDKKITLSDFLTITARPSDSRPVNLQQKISVISRCQDAIRELGGDSLTTGRLFIKKCHRPETPERHHASPLRKIPIVRLNFTSFAKTPEEEPTFSGTVKKLLKTVGVLKEKTSPERNTVQPPKPSRPPKNKKPRNLIVTTTQMSSSLLGSKYLMKMCQTDPYKCEVCEERATRKFEEQGVQCEEKTLVDASTQTVIEEPKNKSLFHMTPAQILAELDRKKEEEAKNKPSTEDPDAVVIDDVLDSGGTLQNKERSVELDHGDKDLSVGKKSAEKPEANEKYWNTRKKGFTVRKKLDMSAPGGFSGRPPYFRSPRGFKNVRPSYKKPYDNDYADVYGPNFDDDDDFNAGNFVQNEQFNNFDDNFCQNIYGGPSNRRPFFEPPEHIKRKFNRRFL